MKAALIALATLTASAAEAQTADALMKAPLKTTNAGVAIDLTRPAPPFTPRYSHAPEPRIPGVAKTAIDHRYDEDVVGSLGFLCGLDQGAERKGAADARGTDQTGRFVGAKLRLAFR